MNELLKHYSKEEIKKLNDNAKKTDAAERVANIKKAEEILRNSTDPSVEAGTILAEEAKLDELINNFVFSDEYDEPLEIYVERGTTEDIFYKTLIKEAGIKISYEEVLDTLDGDGDNIVINNEDDKKIVKKLVKNPVINFLINPYSSRELEGKALEENQLLPEGTTKRLLIRFYEDHIKRCANIISKLLPQENRQKYINEQNIWQNKLEEINKDKSYAAISDQELEKIIKNIIQEQLKNK